VKTFPIKKRINTELFIYRKWGAFIYKSKGGIGSARSDQENIGPLRRDFWREITVAGVKTAAACLGELKITWKINCCGTLSPVTSSRCRLGFGSLKHRSTDPRVPSNLTFPSRKKRYSNTADGQNLLETTVRPLGSETYKGK